MLIGLDLALCIQDVAQKVVYPKQILKIYCSVVIESEWDLPVDWRICWDDDTWEIDDDYIGILEEIFDDGWDWYSSCKLVQPSAEFGMRYPDIAKTGSHWVESDEQIKWHYPSDKSVQLAIPVKKTHIRLTSQ